MFLVDSHCHLDKLNYQSLHKDVNEVLKKAAIRDVRFYLTVSTTLNDYQVTRKLISNRNDVVFSCGVHPLKQDEFYDVDELYRLAMEDGVVAIGETGLDYSYLLETKLHQQESFRTHIQIGRKLNKPIIVHTRDAYNDTLTILNEEKIIDCGGILHCFTADRKTLGKFLNLGLYIAFSGIITFRNSGHLRDVIRYVPLDRLLVETDSPYLTPVPHRGQENHPAMIRDIIECIAFLRKKEVSDISKITTENFFRLFNMNLSRLKF